MGYSRITLATLLALGLLGAAQAANSGKEPFFVELKGPDGAASRAVQPTVRPTGQHFLVKPVASLSSARPVVRQVAGSYGPVRRTDTLWSLANKYRPSRGVTVYQTMVAIYDKNPRSFADGNINHILVGSHIRLPSAAEASVITDAQARQRFNHDNASWKGLSPKYLAGKRARPIEAIEAPPTQITEAPSVVAPKAAPAAVKATSDRVTADKAVADKVAAQTVTASPSQAAPIPTAPPKPVASAPAVAPQPLPAVAPQPSAELTLALEDTNAQLGQAIETNQRLKLRLQAMTEETETLKARLQDQTVLQKELAELRAKSVHPAAHPVSKQGWLAELLDSPLNLAMIILLPVLLVLALVTLWLRARARRELEEQERSLSESTARVMEQESGEFDQLMTVGIADEEPVHPMPGPLVRGGAAAATLAAASDVITGAVTDDSRELAAQAVAPAQVPVAGQEWVDEDTFEPPFEPALAPLVESDHGTGPQGVHGEFARFDLSEPDDTEPASAAWDDGVAEPRLAEVVRHPAGLMSRESASAHDYIGIDRLLAEADSNLTTQEPYQGFSLDVGLDDFPEVLPRASGVDVDIDEGGVGAKLDLARAYLEIDDKESARELLHEAATQGVEYQRTEAERLLRRLG